jgi:hypothetical protein
MSQPKTQLAPQSAPKPDVDPPAAFESMLARERRWASRNGLELDAAGHLVDASDGLCFAPTDDHRSRLDVHPDRPLGEAGKSAPIGELGSAWGLACNLLEAPSLDSLCGVLAALGAEGDIARRSWVHTLPAVAAATAEPPTAQIDRTRGGPVFVEVLGSELALDEAPRAGSLPRPDAGWGDLEGCRRLALETARFAAEPGPAHESRRVAVAPTRAQQSARVADAARPAGQSAHVADAARPESRSSHVAGAVRPVQQGSHVAAAIPLARMLRRIRTLSRAHGRRGFRYVVVRPVFDVRFDARLRRAFDGVRMRIGGEVDFDAIDVGTLIARLEARDTGAHPALGWLADRYLYGGRASSVTDGARG